MITRDILDHREPHRRGVKLLGESSLNAIARPWRLVPHKKSGFKASFQTWSCRRLLFSRAQGDGTIMYRDDEHLGDGYDQYLLVVLIHRGGLTCSQRDRITTAGRGSIVTLLPRESYWSNAEDGTQATMLYVPVDILEGRGVAIEPMAAAIWEAGAVATGIRVLADITLELEDDRRDRRALHFEQALIEMLLGLFSRYVVGRGGKESPAQKVRRQVVDAIADNYWNSSYDVSAIVADVGVSRRSVYKSFEGHEASVGSLLRAKRLDAAEALMRSADVEASLDQIGKAVGFVSGESFARTYKQSRGIAATEYRDRYLGTDPVNAI